MPVATFTKTGNKATTPAKLDKSIFGLEVVNHELLKAAYVAYLANGRANLAITKTRGLVSGGGRKPHPQKGTGRARAGSSRTPIWRGGGIIFGPTGAENYTHKLHKTAKRLSIKQALSIAATDNKLIVIDDIQIKDNKTSEVSKLLSKIGAVKNVLIVADKTEGLIRSSANMSNVKLVSPKYLNAYSVLNADHIVMTNHALNIVTEWLGSKK